MDASTLRAKLDAEHYIYDDSLITTLLVALQLGRPLLIEGAAGVGKTEIAKVMAAALDRELVRLQCYEGLDEGKALYEWNYQKQLLAIQVSRDLKSPEALTASLFSDDYLLERPLLRSIRSEQPVVLLIDEIDKADEEFEAFLLELLSEMQVTIPEVGTIRAKTVPFVVLTSNRTRPLSEALRRRCAYLYIQYPDLEKPVVLLIDEIDKADEEFEAFLLELLSEMQVTIPEVGTIRAKTIPFVVLTSNRTRPLSEALRRRCAYLYIQYPSLEKEVAIIRAKLPNVNERLALQVAQAIHDLRENQAILKKPSIAETLDWVAALEALGISDLTGEAMDQTKGFVLKNSEDLEALSGGGRCGEGGHCGHCHSEAAPEAPDDTDKIARAQDRPTLKVPRTL